MDNDMAGNEADASGNGDYGSELDFSTVHDLTMIGEDDKFDYSKLEDFTTIDIDLELPDGGPVTDPINDAEESDEGSSDEDVAGPEDDDFHLDRLDRANKIARKGALSQNADSSTFFLLEDPVPEDSSTPLGLKVATNPSSRKVKVAGGMLAYAKKVTADLDSDDELIVSMKEQGYSDGQISDRLVSENRVHYNKKTINTRFQRIRMAQAKRVDEMLLEGYKEWKYEDVNACPIHSRLDFKLTQIQDLLLMKAKEMADREIQETIVRTRAKRFGKVALNMYKLNQEAIFSDKACKERYIGLINGTAAIPIELDDNPQKRREELLAYQQSREKAREKATKEIEEKAEAARQAAEASKLLQAERAAEAAAKRQRDAEYKARRELEKSQKKIAGFTRAEQSRQKREAKAAAKKTIEEEKVRAHSLLTIKALNAITPMTPDPRTFLNFADLKTLCALKSVSTQGRTKADLLERLTTADQKLSLVELKQLCRINGLNSSANKPTLIHQLALKECKGYASFQKAIGFQAATAVAESDTTST
jgi:hypothetical protein